MGMITKEELLRIPRLRKHIKRKMQRIELYETRATGGAIEYKERVQSSVNLSVCDCLDYAVDLRAEVGRDIEELHVLVSKAAKLADSLSDPLERDIVYARYVNGKEWVECIDTLHWARSWVFKKHRDVLRAL